MESKITWINPANRLPKRDAYILAVGILRNEWSQEDESRKIHFATYNGSEWGNHNGSELLTVDLWTEWPQAGDIYDEDEPIIPR